MTSTLAPPSGLCHHSTLPRCIPRPRRHHQTIARLLCGSWTMTTAMSRRYWDTRSIKQGIKYDSPQSALDIPAFIEFHGLIVDKILDPLDSLKCSMSSVTGKKKPDKLKPPSQTIEKSDDLFRVVSAAALCSMRRFDGATRLWITFRACEASLKSKILNALLLPATASQALEGLEYLLNHEFYASPSCLSLRVSPYYRHRFLCPCCRYLTSMPPSVIPRRTTKLIKEAQGREGQTKTGTGPRRARAVGAGVVTEGAATAWRCCQLGMIVGLELLPDRKEKGCADAGVLLAHFAAAAAASKYEDGGIEMGMEIVDGLALSPSPYPLVSTSAEPPLPYSSPSKLVVVFPPACVPSQDGADRAMYSWQGLADVHDNDDNNNNYKLYFNNNFQNVDPLHQPNLHHHYNLIQSWAHQRACRAFLIHYLEWPGFLYWEKSNYKVSYDQRMAGDNWDDSSNDDEASPASMGPELANLFPLTSAPTRKRSPPRTATRTAPSPSRTLIGDYAFGEYNGG
ncbi:hypothetical protein D9615_007783 [Tricholomella constricta]|uniref:Uncharacterized protein n=1 Tax=Tricholomella constricta TaxID=117010 RepID=A0A8H5H4R5_9AGAR|nr:hypothetical protein D9615_007783 [Tricholomella constricta]